MTPTGISFSLGFSKGRPSLIVQKLPLSRVMPLAAIETDDGKDTRHIISETDGFGLRIDLVLGPVCAPIPKFWKLDYWTNKSKYVSWTSGNHAGVYKFPCLPGFLFSMCVPWGKNPNGTARQPGFYFGTKSYRVDKTSNAGGWASEKMLGKFYLCFSAAMRHDLVGE